MTAAAPASDPTAPPIQPPAPPIATPAARRRGWGIGRWLGILLTPVLLVLVFTGGAAADRSGILGAPVADSGSPGASPGTSDANLALIEQAWNDIHENYVDAKNLDSKAMAYAAIRGLTDAVGDEGHTTFLTADEAKAVDQSLSGSFVGIGVQVNDDSGKITISSVIPNTPAEEAGLKRGDVIQAVNGTPTAGKSIDDVVSSVRGPEGEKVTLTLVRNGGAPFDVTITRRKFDLPLISWAMVPGTKIAVIRLEQFATGATKALEDAITGAKNDGATALIFDLRGNPGGYVNEAVGVASQFLKDGIVFQSFDASGTEKDSPVEPGGLATDIPMVVLADGDTASSAEIVTGALQDAKRAEVVGEKTFGTGTVLGRFDLADGSSLRIGVERWLTRNGRPIWHEGLVPDVTVALPTDATPIRPSDLKDMTAAELAKSTDAQFLTALALLKGKG